MLISTIDISSTIIASVSSGFSSFLSKLVANELPLESSCGPPLISSNLCIVWASIPQVSLILLAALPVGAASLISSPSIWKYRIMVFIVVVFPVPGPPVITTRPF